MQVVHMGIVAAFAVGGPRVFGLIEHGSSLGQHAFWGAVFGGIGGVVGALIQKSVTPKA